MDVEALKTLLKKDRDSLEFARALAEYKHQGVHENELSRKLGYEDNLPQRFVQIAQTLEVKVHRLDVDGKNPLKFWPSLELLDALQHLEIPWYRKVVAKLRKYLTKIIIAVISTLVAALLLWLLKSLS